MDRLWSSFIAVYTVYNRSLRVLRNGSCKDEEDLAIMLVSVSLMSMTDEAQEQVQRKLPLKQPSLMLALMYDI